MDEDNDEKANNQEHMVFEDTAQTPPSWWAKPVPKTTTYREMIKTRAAPDVLYQHTNSVSRFMILAQMLNMWMLENGVLTEAEKEEAEQLYKSQLILHDQHEARTNELSQLMSYTSQRPHPPASPAGSKAHKTTLHKK